MLDITGCAVCRFALWHGLMTREEIIAWADQEIMRLPQPPYALLELSTCPRTSDMLGLLNQLCPSVEEGAVIPPILRLLANYYQHHPQALNRVWRILSALYWQYPDGFTESEKNAYYRLDEGFDLMPEGYTSASQMAQELGEFLAVFAE